MKYLKSTLLVLATLLSFNVYAAKSGLVNISTINASVGGIQVTDNNNIAEAEVVMSNGYLINHMLIIMAY